MMDILTVYTFTFMSTGQFELKVYLLLIEKLCSHRVHYVHTVRKLIFRI